MGFSLSFLNGFIQLFKWNRRDIDCVGAAVFVFTVDIAVYFIGQGMGFLYDFIPGTDSLDIFRTGLDAGRAIALASRHGKERAIAPVLKERLDLSIIVPEHLDTDALGTFTGEVDRPGDMTEWSNKNA